MESLEAKIEKFDHNVLHPLLGRFEQLESKIVDVEKRIQESTRSNGQNMEGVGELEVMGGWKGLIDLFKSEINEVVSASSRMGEMRMQNEIAQRIDSLTQVFVKELEAQEKRNEERQTFVLNTIHQQMSSIVELCKMNSGIGQIPSFPKGSYGAQVSLKFSTR